MLPGTCCNIKLKVDLFEYKLQVNEFVRQFKNSPSHRHRRLRSGSSLKKTSKHRGPNGDVASPFCGSSDDDVSSGPEHARGVSVSSSSGY